MNISYVWVIETFLKTHQKQHNQYYFFTVRSLKRTYSEPFMREISSVDTVPIYTFTNEMSGLPFYKVNLSAYVINYSLYQRVQKI